MEMEESGKENIKTSESSKPSLENDKEVKKEGDEKGSLNIGGYIWLKSINL